LALPKTSVVAVGIDPPLLTGHALEPLTLPIDAPRDALEDLAIELQAGAVAVLPSGRLEPALRRLHVLQSALDGRSRIACCQTELSPLAAGVLVALAASVAPYAPSAALLADALPAIEQELLVAAVLPRVLRLRKPRPPLGARLRSLLPGARFLVSPEPEPIVAPVHWRHKPPLLLGDPGDDVAVVHAGRLRGLGAPEQLLAEAFGGAAVQEVKAPPGLAGRWRVTQAIEAVAYPTDAEAMARRVLALPATTCPWCGESHAALPCALCGHDRDREITTRQVLGRPEADPSGSERGAGRPAEVTPA
jgi:hypothetical protein